MKQLIIMNILLLAILTTGCISKKNYISISTDLSKDDRDFINTKLQNKGEKYIHISSKTHGIITSFDTLMLQELSKRKDVVRTGMFFNGQDMIEEFLYLPNIKSITAANLTNAFPNKLNTLEELNFLTLSFSDSSKVICDDFSDLKKNQSLNSLSIDNFYFDSIPAFLDSLHNLTRLCINIKSFYQGQHLKNLNKLDELSISIQSSIDSIPSALLDLTNLKMLSLSVNSLKSLANIDKLKKLKEFRITISGITDSSAPLHLSHPTLNNFFCTDKNIREIHFTDCKSLKYINIEDAPIQLLSIKNAPNLEQFMLRFGNLTQIPEAVKNAKKLKYLELWYSKISSFPDFTKKLKNLDAISLRGNHIKEIPASIGKFKNLRILDLSMNHGISKLPKEIQKLKKLKHIDLTGTQIPKEEIEALRKAMPWCEIRTTWE